MIRSGKAPLPGPLFIYGAYGTTGAMIARVAVARGHDVVLSGSDRDRLARLSAEMGVPGVDALMSRSHSADSSGLRLA